jgi:hypothetical protein
MADERIEGRCEHPGCDCPVAQGERWCSPHCETAPDEVMCGCGHAGCVTGAPDH